MTCDTGFVMILYTGATASMLLPITLTNLPFTDLTGATATVRAERQGAVVAASQIIITPGPTPAPSLWFKFDGADFGGVEGRWEVQVHISKSGVDEVIEGQCIVERSIPEP